MEDFEEVLLNVTNSSYNYKTSMLTVVQPDSVKFFETQNFREYSESFEKNVPNIEIAHNVNKSSIVLLVGSHKNEDCPPNKVVFYDLETQQSIAEIKICLNQFNAKDKIYSIFSSNIYVFVVTLNKIYMFNLYTLELLFCFYDVNGLPGHVAFEYNEDFSLLAYVSATNNNIIKINKITNAVGEIMHSQRYITTNFEDGIQYLAMSPMNKFIAAANGSGQKIHVYSLKSYKIRRTLLRGKKSAKIMGIIFDKEAKYLGVYDSLKFVKIYPLLKKFLVKEKAVRKGRNYVKKKEMDDEEDYYSYEKQGDSKYDFLKEGYKEPYAEFKGDKKIKNDILTFFFNRSKDIVMVDKSGKIMTVMFNKRKGGLCSSLDSGSLQISYI